MPEQYRNQCLRYHLGYDANKENPDEIQDAIGLASSLGAAFDGVHPETREVVYRCRQLGCSLYIALGANALHGRNDAETREAGIAACEYTD